MRRFILTLFLVGSIILPPATTLAQVLVANDDRYGVPFGAALSVEAYGVLDNDTLDDNAAGENGATVELVTDVGHGTLALASDGSFTYSVDPTFEGIDSFVYRAVFGAASSEGTVTLSACTGGPDLFTCWKETAFDAEVATLGFPSYAEGFEDDFAWAAARSPDTAPSVVSQGIRWQSNHPDPPASNEITTGPGPARTGNWAVFDLEHGYATGTPSQCDIDNPPSACLYHDGVTGIRESGLGALHGVGGYFTGTFGANIAIILDEDEAHPLGGGQLTGGGHQFFGVIDARPAGFSRFEFREQDGKVGQSLFIFGDDFTLVGEEPAAVPGLPLEGLIVAALLQAAIAARRIRRRT